VPDRIVIEGMPQGPIPTFVVEAGESTAEVLARLGMKKLRIEHVPPPTELELIAARAQEVGAEVSALLSFCVTADDVPTPEHLPRPDDDCVVCDARRIVIEMLGRR
jgi:hypothetical protein